MLKIGDFSKLAQVSIKTLRHYGKLGLLRPAWVDRFTSYRYYALDQLPRLNRILALKDLGFSLEQIGQLLRDDLSAAELRAMLKVRHAELEQQIQAEQARLARIENRLRQIELEGALPQYEVVFKSVRPQRVVGIRDVVPGYHGLERLFGELGDYLQTQRVPPEAAQPRLAVYYDAEYRERGLDVEVAAPAPRSLPGTARVRVHQLPGVESMACVVHSGPYEDLGGAYNALAVWIEANGYLVSGPNRDVYLQGPEPGCVTEVQFPVQKKPSSIFVTQLKEKKMEPKIETRPAFTVVGMLYHGTNENNQDIPRLWEEFMPRMQEVKHAVNAPVCYGVCDELEEDDRFKYVAGFEVSSTADIPEGMVSWQVPQQKYAVFNCTLSTIRQAYEHAHNSWLPQSGYQRAHGPDFEFYGGDFDPSHQDPRLTIHIPIE